MIRKDILKGQRYKTRSGATALITRVEQLHPNYTIYMVEIGSGESARKQSLGPNGLYLPNGTAHPDDLISLIASK